MPKKRMPVAERRRESEAVMASPPLAVSYNWPDTGPGARTRKRADVWQVSLGSDAVMIAGTEGQVRRDGGLQLHPPGLGGRQVGRPRRDRGDGGPDGERTGGPAPRRALPVGSDRLASAGGAGTAAAAADLQGGAGRRPGESQEPA